MACMGLLSFMLMRLSALAVTTFALDPFTLLPKPLRYICLMARRVALVRIQDRPFGPLHAHSNTLSICAASSTSTFATVDSVTRAARRLAATARSMAITSSFDLLQSSFQCHMMLARMLVSHSSLTGSALASARTAARAYPGSLNSNTYVPAIPAASQIAPMAQVRMPTNPPGSMP